MTRNEYLDELRRRLAALDPDDAARAVDFYDEAIADRLEAGESEEQAVAELEPPAQAAARILEELPAVPRTFARLRAAKLGGGALAVLIALVVLGSPLWLALLAAALVAVAACFLFLGSMLLLAWVFTVLFLLAAPFGIYLLVMSASAGSLPFGLAWAGAGLVMGGIGVLAIRPATYVTGVLLRAIYWLARKVASPFVRFEKPAQWVVRPRRSASARHAWQLVTIVAGALAAAGVVACLASGASLGFDRERFYAEGDRVTAVLNERFEPQGWHVTLGRTLEVSSNDHSAGILIPGANADGTRH